MATLNPVANVVTLDTTASTLATKPGAVDTIVYDYIVRGVDASGTQVAFYSTVGLKRQDETAAGPGGTVDLSNYYTKSQDDANLLAQLNALLGGASSDSNTLAKLAALIGTERQRINNLLAGSQADIDTFIEVYNRFLQGDTVASALQNSLNNLTARVQALETTQQQHTQQIGAIQAVIPGSASSTNQVVVSSDPRLQGQAPDLSNYYNKSQTDNLLGAKASKQDIANLIGAAPAALDTLEEIARQLQADEQGTAGILATQSQHTQQISDLQTRYTFYDFLDLTGAQMDQVMALSYDDNNDADPAASPSWSKPGMWFRALDSNGDAWQYECGRQSYIPGVQGRGQGPCWGRITRLKP